MSQSPAPSAPFGLRWQDHLGLITTVVLTVATVMNIAAAGGWDTQTSLALLRSMGGVGDDSPGITLGYGYQPWRALIALLVVTLVSALRHPLVPADSMSKTTPINGALPLTASSSASTPLYLSSQPLSAAHAWSDPPTPPARSLPPLASPPKSSVGRSPRCSSPDSPAPYARHERR
jgi:hypothetical protein